MPAFDAFGCVECNTEPNTLADANTARTGYWSPACESSAGELTERYSPSGL